MTTMLRLRAVQLALVALMVMTPKPYRRELESCFNRLDDEAKAMERVPGVVETVNPEEVPQ
ncbi:MAG: hypothetical protein ACOZEN_09030 [Thermodesulfobacteriota bacterium]|jgi:hypothetical protein